MPRLENEGWELFAQGVAKGLTLTKAYEKAGYDAHSSNAARLIGNDSVSDRVAELQELAVQKTLVTIERLTDELEEARNLAMLDEKGASAAVSAVMAKAKLHGLDVNKIDTKVSGNLTLEHKGEALELLNSRIAGIIARNATTGSNDGAE